MDLETLVTMGYWLVDHHPFLFLNIMLIQTQKKMLVANALAAALASVETVSDLQPSPNKSSSVLSVATDAEDNPPTNTPSCNAWFQERTV